MGDRFDVSCCAVLALFTGVIAIAAPALDAAAQAYPSHPVRLVVPYPPGGGNDNMGRLVAQKLAETLKQSVVVDNRGGAGGRLGAELVAKSVADGYTLLMGGSTLMITAPALYVNLAYNVQRDFAPVSSIGHASYVLVVHPAVPARTVREFTALARSRPGALNYCSSGSGGPAHLAGELFQSLTGTKMIHVPYKGGSVALTQLLAGETDFTFGNIQPTTPLIRAGRLRAIAVTSAKRSPVLPDVPTFAEGGLPGLEVAIYYGILAPAATPHDIVARLNAALVQGFGTVETRRRVESYGAEVMTGTPDDFARLLRTETDKWAKVIKAAGIKPE